MELTRVDENNDDNLFTSVLTDSHHVGLLKQLIADETIATTTGIVVCQN